ncbi:MAG: Ig-like domain-containing protein, partial [Oscillospiraceae bacterium]|nr:Ig-like domain-containing protein [Oscillospiraceae bacterium]
LSTSPIPSNATLPGGLVWHSWNTNVATVDQNGRVTAQQTGTVDISVRTGNWSVGWQTVQLTVIAPLTGIAIGNLPLNNRMTVGDARTLSTSPIPSNATLPGGLVWHSWNTNVATVDQNGRVTAQQTGTVDISVRTGNWSVGWQTVQLTVVAPAAPNITITWNGNRGFPTRVGGSHTCRAGGYEGRCARTSHNIYVKCK